MIDYTLLEKQLTGEYRAAYGEAVKYIFTSSFSSDFTEEKMTELFDLLLTAQTNGKPVRQLVGDDPARFCRNFFSDYGIRERLLSFLHTLYTIAWIVLISMLLQLGSTEHPFGDFFSHRVQAGGFVVGCAIGLVFNLIVSLLRPVAMKNKKITTDAWAWIITGSLAVWIIAGIALFPDLKLRIPLWIALLLAAVYIAGYFTVRSIVRYRRYGTIRNTRRQLSKDSYYRELDDKNYERIIIESWVKQYHQLSKKGKVTEETFIEKVRVNEKHEKIGDMILNAVCLGVILVMMYRNAFVEKAGLTDTLIFGAVLSTFEFFVMRFYRKFTKQALAMRRKLVADCEAKGMTMPAYLNAWLEQNKVPASETV